MATIDFGNGVIAGTGIEDGTDILILGHSGLEYPDVDVPTVEGAVTDGGTLGTSRAKMRRMTALLDFGGTMTRADIAALFSPGVLRLLSSDRGVMPYTVSAVALPAENHVSGVSVAMVSAYAYPEAPEQTAELPAAGIIESLADVECAPVFEITMPAETLGLTITTPGCVTTLIGWFSEGDLVVVDSSAHTITVNGSNRLDWLDRSGGWFPRLVPGENYVSVRDGTDSDVPATVTWRPRVMGLL